MLLAMVETHAGYDEIFLHVQSSSIWMGMEMEICLQSITSQTFIFINSMLRKNVLGRLNARKGTLKKMWYSLIDFTEKLW